VPEKRQEVTTEGGLDVAGQRDKMRDACQTPGRCRYPGLAVYRCG
jgi:pyridoxine 5'-phosphate synthase PdxJ